MIEEGRARWQPLLNREGDRRRLEELAVGIPQVATCALAAGLEGHPALACRRPSSGRLRVASLLAALLDGQLRSGFQCAPEGLDPLLLAWQKGLGKGDGSLRLDEEELERLNEAIRASQPSSSSQRSRWACCSGHREKSRIGTPAGPTDYWDDVIGMTPPATVADSP
ncbi:hypothetical protein [Cyanobium sp. ATX 6A2]|uniref:hypothetical protein n=1 Tax=Cyanobium sp. ATX 6A2 TaxID=2823700 RepID=UPI0020CFD31C|nr:hypothetical protein [Cyanobium sp. ATX 6A2]